MIRNRLNHWHGVSPMNQVRRPGQPDAPGVDFRVGSIQPRVSAVERFRENHDIAHVRLTDERNSLDSLKIVCLSQPDAHPKSGIRTVSNVVLAGNGTNSRVLDTVFFVNCEINFGGRDHKRPGICLELVAVIASCDSDNRSSVSLVRTK